MKLVDSVVRSFKVAKVFHENTDKINSLDFSHDGCSIISCSEDDKVVVYDSQLGQRSKTINSKKYGVDLIRFAHNKSTAIHSSNKVDDTLRYLSLHDNKYIRYFKGHTKKVVSLCVSPIEDILVSGSMDNSIRLWDLRSPNCRGLINLMGKPVVGFDPEGFVLAVGINSEILRFFDIRSFDKGPFMTVKLQHENDWTDLKFSPDGLRILIPTNGPQIQLINSFSGETLQSLTGHLNNREIPIEASFSPDSQYIFSGSTDGCIHVWNALYGYKVCVLDGDHPDPVHCVKFNPKYMMMASACTNMAFWLPTTDDGTNLS